MRNSYKKSDLAPTQKKHDHFAGNREAKGAFNTCRVIWIYLSLGQAWDPECSGSLGNFRQQV